MKEREQQEQSMNPSWATPPSKHGGSYDYIHVFKAKCRYFIFGEVENAINAVPGVLTKLEEMPLTANAKVIRVGALSARESDGEFQINFLSNSAMEQLRSFAILNAFPYSNMDQDMRFGPIDASARSFMHLARTPKECCLFHAINNHSTPAIDVIRVMQECGIEIELVEDDVFLQIFLEHPG